MKANSSTAAILFTALFKAVGKRPEFNLMNSLHFFNYGFKTTENILFVFTCVDNLIRLQFTMIVADNITGEIVVHVIKDYLQLKTFLLEYFSTQISTKHVDILTNLEAKLNIKETNEHMAGLSQIPAHI